MPNVEVVDWAGRYLYRDPPFRFVSVASGRAAGKSWAIAQFLAIRGLQRRQRIVAGRLHLTRLKESSHPNIETQIQKMGLEAKANSRVGWRIMYDRFVSVGNGSVILFNRINTGSDNVQASRGRDTLVGWHDINICWVDEAASMTQRDLDTLIPTVRGMNALMVFSFNSMRRSDPIYQFHMDIKDGLIANSVAIDLTWRNNPWFHSSPVLHEARLDAKRTMAPEDYEHIWEGKTKVDDKGITVLPYDWLEMCVDDYNVTYLDEDDPLHAGWDIAHTGQNKNSLCIRRGAVVLNLESWHSPIEQAARIVMRKCKEYGVHKLYWDEGGIGAGARTALTLANGGNTNWGFTGRGVNFGSAVAGPERKYTVDMRNDEYFVNRGTQLAFAVRQRANRTRLRRLGEEVHSAKCLYFAEGVNVDKRLMQELEQPIIMYKDSELGKARVEKEPDGARSPDRFDSLRLAYTEDSKRGLKIR